MRLTADLVNEVVFLIDRKGEIIDGFHVVGRTEYVTSTQPVAYTYRSHLLQPGQCALCGKGRSDLNQKCVSRQGYHAFLGLADEVPDEQKAEFWKVDVKALVFEGQPFYLDAENLFDIADLVENWNV